MALGSIRIGAVFPHFSLGTDIPAIRDFAHGIEAIGFDHIYVYDHVLGGDATDRPELHGRYTSRHPFHEVMTLFGFLAGITERLELVSGVVILPQRQTALVAKQAAEIALLSGDRFRLGVGIGWNPIEYEALGENFRNRGKRFEEQIALLRRFFSEETFSFDGQWHRVDRAGIQPLPNRPIPIWIGGSSEVAVRRAARIADGFFPNQRELAEDEANLRMLHDELAKVGRDAANFGIESRINLVNDDEDDWKRRYAFWREHGATHITLATIVQPSEADFDHLERLERAYRILETEG
jgi:probable F420-dependent oxidoreductase